MKYGENISLQIMLANKTYHQQLFKILEDVDIHHHFHVILLLTRQGGRTTQKVLCDQLQIEKSNMVAIVDLLEKKGYITREINYRDRRGKMVVCTQKAWDIVSTFEDAFHELEDNVVHDISWQEMHNFLYVLRRINHNLALLGNPKGVAIK
ncbi:MarR family winged helix-turn-helix transcriptional regulator [Mucilaginibacter sp. L3T2-6]|uniref:MarR family winged helix-turn-helix transcriptional regulator n=1 Tax=Mucilaginibacter sp. L3T2-6 TaxID=3062491 RepID=UPI00267525E1|nr:MarR family transcriptional regulator [Mucilaginibacter sp. L3T2-6]MDO3643281.1 MarR family transcriptional regulator [Mucilaginibacter sp. L3T2-6]MDV6215605.1 MarR family transcriptional regulator [Mucilaginibacter sp. L3T2-6]